MNYKYMMIQSLEALLEDVERLNYPIYATWMKDKPCFGFFGFTKKVMLVAIMDSNQRKIEWSKRIPLSDIRNVAVKKALIPWQQILTFEFADGENCKLRISKKIMNIDCQEKNVVDFIAYLEKRTSCNQ